MIRRLGCALASAALVASSFYILSVVYRHHLPLPGLGASQTAWYATRYDLVIPALLALAMLAVATECAILATGFQSQTLRRLIFMALGALLLLAGVYTAVLGVGDLISFAQHDSPADDFAGIVYGAHLMQMTAALAVCGLGIAYMYFARQHATPITSTFSAFRTVLRTSTCM